MLTRILYHSRPTPGVVFHATLEAIRASCLRNNPKRDVTGALAYSEAQFFQVVEGSESEIGDLLRTLLADERHVEMRVLDRRYVPHRMFADWAMAIAPLEDFDPMAHRYPDQLRFLLEAAQRCGGVRAIPGRESALHSPPNQING